MRPLLLVIITFLTLGSTEYCSGQFNEQQRRESDRLRKNWQNRQKYLLEKYKRDKQHLQEKVLRAIMRDVGKNIEDSNGVFGSARTWTVGLSSVEAHLASIKNGKVTVVTSEAAVHRELIKNFSEENQERVRLFREWRRLGKKKREEWMAQNRDKLVEKKSLANLNLSDPDKPLTDIEILKAGYEKIVIHKTTEQELGQLLGDKSKQIGPREKSFGGESGTLEWYAKNDKDELVKLTVEIRGNKVYQATKEGF